jgi:hypothetical protein
MMISTKRKNDVVDSRSLSHDISVITYKIAVPFRDLDTDTQNNTEDNDKIYTNI